MNALAFAWRSLVRQPARATLGILGVAAVGALLFDMLLLSEGLVISMRDLFERTGFDVRVASTNDLPGRGRRIADAEAVAETFAALPSVRHSMAIRLANARVEQIGSRPLSTTFQGIAGGQGGPWTVLRGRDVEQTGDAVVSTGIATSFGLEPGAALRLRASCSADSVLPPMTLRVVGVADFPFEAVGERSVGTTLDTVEAACGGNASGEADFIVVRSAGDPDLAAAAIRALRPDLRAATNEEMIGRFRESGFTYFRQISTVLTAVTVTFAVLLITVLLTVSVNQRLGEIAALRALGLSRRRVVADVLCESALMVGIGGLLSLPIGALLATWLDGILKRMPEIPAGIHFFVFETGALVVHVSLIAATALIAAVYPMLIVARLPIAATLRNEVIS
jgi:putative ABC transport system permease protein